MEKDVFSGQNELQLVDDRNLQDVRYLRTQISNVVLVGEIGAQDEGWVLIDAGMPGSEQAILREVEDRFGLTRPHCIILTHGHFDHVGALIPLAHHYDVPIYAHALELPYLTGQADYPPADPTVGGGLMSLISKVYPKHGIDMGDAVRMLPEDGTVPGLPEWRWIHTPGHTEGHVSLFRERDRAMIVGDAFTTVKQESAYAVLTQNEELHGPPAYFTTDWDMARHSVRRLQAMQPQWAVTGHGRPMHGQLLRDGLEALARDFDIVARPAHGRYS